MSNITTICVLTNTTIHGLKGTIEFTQENNKNVEIVVNISG